MRLAFSTLNVLKGEILVFFINLFTSILIARTLGLNALGIWSILRLLSTYFECIGRLKTESALIYFIGKKFKKSDVFLASIFINLVMCLVLYIFTYFNFQNIYDFFFKNLSQDYTLELNLVIISIIFRFMYINFTSLFIAIGDIKSRNKLIIFYSLITLFLTSVCLLFTPFGVRGLCIVDSLSLLNSTIYSFRLIPKKFFNNCFLSFCTIKNVFIYSIKSYLASILQELEQSGSRLITASLLAPSSIAFIDQGQKFSMLLQKIVSPLYVTIFPKISRSDKKEATNIISRVIKLYSLILIIFSVILYISIKPIILILYGKDFIPIINVVYILIPSIFFKNITQIISMFFAGTGKPIKNTYMQFINVFLQLTLTILFVRKLGFYGVVISMAISSFIYAFLFITYFLRSSKINISQIVPKSSDFKYLYSFLKDYKEFLSK